MSVFLQVQKKPGSNSRPVDLSKGVLQDGFGPLKDGLESCSGSDAGTALLLYQGCVPDAEYPIQISWED